MVITFICIFRGRQGRQEGQEGKDGTTPFACGCKGHPGPDHPMRVRQCRVNRHSRNTPRARHCCPPPKKVKEDTYNFTKDQEIGIAAWLSENDWLWKQGVSILFIILFICMYLYVYNWYSA